MKFLLYIFIVTVFMSACDEDPAQKAVDQSIAEHGGELFQNVHIEFDFRNRHYVSHRQEGIFTYTREFPDSSGHIKDVLTNDRFHREINGGLAKISEERAKAFTNSVNSVIYFALLPYGLNDRAVIKKYIKETEIKGKKYDLIKVTFQEDGGGKDHEDVFLYWIEKDSHTLDYFAYSYETDGGGVRFREAVNRRAVEGITFQDYINYEPKTPDATLEDMEALYKNGQLKKLSDIILENIEVRLLPKT
ncbi:DUF6503 family protein [Chryseolinea sp. H1M3-3]|uniref:DUF6503 family protein n=1 Tax=Chryseolinea sp. H1M3-3 TaxID=3034144 RepID=UPI0023EB93A1|nr:DUF6503 family protein [Chryseolinea sp. H1M3-3]